MFENNPVPDTVTLKKGRRACRRQAEELRVAYHLHRQFALFASAEASMPEIKAQAGQRQLFNAEALSEKKEWLRDLSGDSQRALLKTFKKLEEGGPWRDVAQAADIGHRRVGALVDDNYLGRARQKRALCTPSRSSSQKHELSDLRGTRRLRDANLDYQSSCRSIH